jgi:hypothetical protein
MKQKKLFELEQVNKAQLWQLFSQGAAAEEQGHDSGNPAQLEGEASSVSLGISDVTKTETTGSGSDTTPGEPLCIC